MSDHTVDLFLEWIAEKNEIWMRELYHAIARAADRNDYDLVSANDLHDDTQLVLPEDKANSAPGAAFRSCAQRGFLRKVGVTNGTGPRRHAGIVRVWQVTTKGRKAFERLVEVGAGVNPPPGTSPDLGETQRPTSGSPLPLQGTTGADSDGGQGKSAPSELLPLPGLEPQATPGHIDPDQRDRAA